MSCLESNSLFHLASGVWSVASAWFQFCCQWERESLSHSHLSQKTKYIKSEQFLLYFECELSTWGGNLPEGFTLKAKQSKISCSPLMVCVWLQGGGSVRGMTVPSAVPQPLPPVISAHAPFAGITRKEPSPPLHLKAVSAAPVTTLPVPWAPIPALPSHTAPPRAPSEWKKSQRRRQGRPWRLPTDSAAQLNTSFPVKCATVGLQATSGPKQCAMEGNTVLYDQCCGPHAKKRHTDEHLSAVCGTTSVLTGEVSRHHWHCSSYFFFFFLAMKHYLYSSVVPVWWNHRLILFSFVIFQSWRNHQCYHLHILALWRNNKVRSRKQRQVEEARSKLSISSTTEPLHSLFTCCKMSLSHTGELFLQSSLPTSWSPNILLLSFFFLEKGRGQNDWICAIFVSPGTTLHSNVPTYVFNILMGIDKYNYIQYLCLLMFTDRRILSLHFSEWCIMFVCLGVKNITQASLWK